MEQTEFKDREPTFDEPSKTMSQSQFANLLGVNQSVISRLIADGIINSGEDWKTWLRKVYRHRAETSAGRHGDGPLDLVQERARLAARQSEKLEIEIAEKQKQLWPLTTLAKAVLWSFSTVRTRLLSIAHRFKSLCPMITTQQYKALEDLIREVLTELSITRFPPQFAEMAEAYYKKLHHDSKEGAHEEKKRRRPRKATSKTPGRHKKARSGTTHPIS